MSGQRVLLSFPFNCKLWLNSNAITGCFERLEGLTSSTAMGRSHPFPKERKRPRSPHCGASSIHNVILSVAALGFASQGAHENKPWSRALSSGASCWLGLNNSLSVVIRPVAMALP
jgi:hypothetical protein